MSVPEIGNVIDVEFDIPLGAMVTPKPSVTVPIVDAGFSLS